MALLVVDQAIAELDQAGVAASPPREWDDDVVTAAEVFDLLRWVAAMLSGYVADAADPLACARTTMLVREAVGRLSDG
jgi:hypothetical protein